MRKTNLVEVVSIFALTVPNNNYLIIQVINALLIITIVVAYSVFVDCVHL